MSGQTSFLQDAAATPDPGDTSNLAGIVGSQLRTDLTNMGGAANLLQQGNNPAAGSQTTTPDISGAVQPLAQNNIGTPNNLALPDRH